MTDFKKDVDLTGKVKFQTQFDPYFGDRNAQNVACARATKKALKDAGFQTTDATGRIDAVVYDEKKKLIRSKDWQKAVDQLHLNCDHELPTAVAVNRGPKDVGNANKASNHYVYIVGRKYNAETGKYEYRFYDPGTSYPNKGTDASQIFTLDENGFWSGVSKYCGLKYVITEIRPTATL